MLTKTTRFVITALFASPVFAQLPAAGTLDQVLHFTHAETEQDLQEIATDIRGITDIPQVSIDTARRTLTLHGTAAQIALAEWLLNQWENPAQEPTTSAAHEYRLSSDDIVRVLFLAHAGTPKRLQETATNVRSIADIRRLFVYNAPSAITLRGDTAQIALAEWLVKELDKPVNQAARSSASYEYRPSSSVEDVVRIFYPAQTKTPQALQEMATDVRTISDIRRLFTYSATSALILRDTPARIALAEWLVTELDQPANEPPRTPAPHEYRPSGTVDDVVRVFFLAHTGAPQRLQEIATEVRTTAEIRRLFTYSAHNSLIARGTTAQITLADRLIAEKDR